MRLRRVRLRDTTGAETSVAVWDEGRWLPLVPALAASGAGGASDPVWRDVVAFCGEVERLRPDVERLLAFVHAESLELESTFEPAPELPFTPVSFRDFMLYEEHAVAAARGWVRRFRPAVAPAVALYEAVLRRPPPPLRPHRLWHERPIYYMGSHLAFVPDGATIPWPTYTRALDYELELGLVVCRPLQDATPEAALAAIGGFVIVNDFSARDVQYEEMRSGFGPVKAKNFASALSVAVVTADELRARVEDLAVEVRVNGTTWGRGSTAGMRHTLGEMVAYASLGERLVPGELLATGTIPGCSGMESGHWLAPGDEIELRIDGIGSLRNLVGQPGRVGRLGHPGRGDGQSAVR